jgi:steroid 5-alpha reductase family enzyme
MVLFYLIQLKTRNATLVDVAWAAGVGLTSCFYATTGTGDAGRRIMLAILAGTWGFRLACYLILRSLGKPEDGRYAMLRSKWGASGALNFFLFYQAQASWVVLFSIPFLIVTHNVRELWAWHDLAALVIWITAIAGESCADWQLNRFRADSTNQGKTCREGLWKYSRHPNYFFEWLHWLTYVFLAIGSSWWWISLSGPVVMLLFLYKVTGIPYTEKRALQSRGEDYHRYQRTTSAFIPWFPKKDSYEADN